MAVARGSIGQIMTARVLLKRAVPVPTCIFAETAVTWTRQFVSESGSLNVVVALPVLSVRRFAVQNALSAADMHGLTVTEVRGFGRQRGHKETYRGAEYTVDFLPKVKLEIVVDDGDESKAVETILGVARTGQIGDGKIFVTNLAEVIRIRTGETGPDAV